VRVDFLLTIWLVNSVVVKTVKRVRDAEASKARVFEAAAEEFAAHGFAGGKVDRIASRARVNKAMIYYHFKDKAALYRAVVGDMFAATAARLRDLRATSLSPEAQIDEFIAIVAREGQARKYFPRKWLSELADDGRHMGDRNFAQQTDSYPHVAPTTLR